MSTTPLTDAINALTQYANETTGASDTNLSDAVGTLVAGYGGGGGSNKETEILSGSLSGAYENTTVTTLRERALADCTQMTSVSLPALTTAGSSAFRNDNHLSAINLPELASIGTYCFYNCSQLNNVYLPKLGIINNNSFENCTGLTSASFPAATRVNNSACRNCRFTIVVMPTVTIMEQNAFSVNTPLTAVDLTSITQMMGQWGFADNPSFSTLIIRNTNAVPSLGNISWFNNTPFASGKAGGTLYVPQSLISSYQSANNWSTILGYANNSIQAIEGSQYENYYADGTPIE